MLRIGSDTNIIIEAIDMDIWKLISKSFQIETVEKCLEEVLTGNVNSPKLSMEQRKSMRAGISVLHKITSLDKVRFIFAYEDYAGLDEGELHLLSWLYNNGNINNDHELFIATADQAAIRAIYKMGWCDKLITLEELARRSGVKKSKLNFRPHYTNARLSRIKSNLLLEVL